MTNLFLGSGLILSVNPTAAVFIIPDVFGELVSVVYLKEGDEK